MKAKSYPIFLGKFTRRLNLLCTREDLGYSHGIGSERFRFCPSGSPGFIPLICGYLSRSIGNTQSRQRSTPEHPFGGNAVVYQKLNSKLASINRS
jgi:hypothetical protein